MHTLTHTHKKHIKTHYTIKNSIKKIQYYLPQIDNLIHIQNRKTFIFLLQVDTITDKVAILLLIHAHNKRK